MPGRRGSTDGKHRDVAPVCVLCMAAGSEPDPEDLAQPRSDLPALARDTAPITPGPRSQNLAILT